MDGVENGVFYPADGDGNFKITEAAANDFRLRLIEDGIGDQCNREEMSYLMYVGNCGHSRGGHHGAEGQSRRDQISGGFL